MKKLPVSFWENESRILQDVILKRAWKMAQQGALEGEDLLKGSAEIQLDWGLINDQARAWAVVHTAQVVAQISNTSMETFERHFPDWVASGKPLQALIDELTPIYKSRASMIAATETTRAYAQGNIITWGASGVVDRIKWFTARDEWVCPICRGDLSGAVTELGKSFPGYEFTSPPAHPGCRCWIQPSIKDEFPGEKPPKKETIKVGKSPISDPAPNPKQAIEWLQPDGIEPVASGEKDRICKTLSDRTKIPYQNINDFIKQWAKTSNDSSYASLHVQEVASKVFNSPMSKWQKAKYTKIKKVRQKLMESVNNGVHPGSDVLSAGIDIFDDFRYVNNVPVVSYNEGVAAVFKTSDEAIEAVLKAMYAHTQEELQSSGIKEIVVFRGKKTTQKELDALKALEVPAKSGADVPVTGNALESWSAKEITAKNFGDTIFTMRIPAERVVGTCKTGFGCTFEAEFVVTGNVPGDIANYYRRW
jgi:SPP1 gp7 family putative phage head morphogenesis protein